MRRRVKLFALLIVVALALPAAASAQVRPDSAAPAGTTDPLWLPDEEWVMERWVPFDEVRLYRALGMTRMDVYLFLKAGRGSLSDLAAQRRVKLTAAALLEGRRKQVDAATYRLLVARTRRLLSQRHLAEHVLGHPWHRWSLMQHLTDVFGPEVPALKAEGVVFEGLAARVPVPRHVLRDRILTRLRESGRRGVARGEMSLYQARTVERQDAIQVEAPLSGQVALLCMVKP